MLLTFGQLLVDFRCDDVAGVAPHPQTTMPAQRRFAFSSSAGIEQLSVRS
jgi:hypothetical protein